MNSRLLLGAFSLSLFAFACGDVSLGGPVADHGSPAPSGTGSHQGPPSSSDGGTSNPPSASDSGTTSAPAGAKYVFVTSVHYTGDLGGVAGADAKCQTAATAAGLAGTYKAWISTYGASAADRITGDGPWYGTDPAHTKVFNNHANLLTVPHAFLEYDENGQFGGGGAWTGTEQGGVASGLDCGGWNVGSFDAQGSVGSCDETQDWGSQDPQYGGTPCGAQESLICLGQ